MKDDVVVIGAGIVGAACAANLVLAGKKVTIIDRLLPGEGCSFGNAGGLSPSISFPLATPDMFKHIPGWLFDPDGPLVVAWKRIPAATPWLIKFLRQGTPAKSALAATGMRKMLRASFDDYLPLFTFAGAEQLIHKVGQLYLYSTKEGFEQEKSAIEARKSLGIEQLILDSKQLREFEPALSPMFGSGIFFPTHGHCSNPQQLVQMLIQACIQNGAKFISGSVQRIAPLEDSVLIHTDGNSIQTGQVVLATGVWSNELIQPLGWKAPLESQRGYHIQIAHSGVKATRNVLWSEKKTLVTPMDDGLRVAGTAEIAGLNAPPTRRRFALLRDLAQQMYPTVNVEQTSEWMGHRPCTPDSLPVIGPLPNNPRVICAFGHGHVGLTGASFTGRVVRDIAMGGLDKHTHNEWTPFSIERF
ncbi:FAD-binding oxidoreductase [Glaciimonas sp. PCH181]|uniref:NAD(P)/FAD-dependent oxidoreductase n=1 Tax=Glaciimonas sp. PCH181 TaxID=2133943 RepID=UPI001374E387|nr:FAD-dependent oxidoreductase [Glaciimonas sp. PCH181]